MKQIGLTPLHNHQTSTLQPLYHVTSAPQSLYHVTSSSQPLCEINLPQPSHHETSSLTPYNKAQLSELNLDHNKSIWKQECIISATNLLANLNEIEHITESIKRLCANVPDEIDETMKILNVEMGAILEKVNKNEDIRKLKDISSKVWKERNIQGKKNKYIPNEISIHLRKKQRRHNYNA